MATLQEFSIKFSAFGRNLRKELKTFLPRERGRYLRIYQESIRTNVYDAYTPVSYERTYNLMKSARAYLPEENNPMVLFIDSDASVAPAKLAGTVGGYPQFVAGEGPGIGFLWRTVPDAFPREFTEPVFQIIQNEITYRLIDRVDKVIAKL